VIDEYNSGAANVEAFYAKLTAFARKLDAEERRGIAEHALEFFEQVDASVVHFCRCPHSAARTDSDGLLSTALYRFCPR
jgi:hypothetical protein